MLALKESQTRTFAPSSSNALRLSKNSPVNYPLMTASPKWAPTCTSPPTTMAPYKFSAGPHNTIMTIAPQALIGEVGRSAMLLILTIFIGIWYQATSEKRRKFISDYRSRQP